MSCYVISPPWYSWKLVPCHLHILISLFVAGAEGRSVISLGGHAIISVLVFAIDDELDKFEISS